jgi:hypothetical protein
MRGRRVKEAAPRLLDFRAAGPENPVRRQSAPPSGDGMSDAEVSYRHTQVGWWLLAVLAAGAAVVAFAATKVGWGGPARPVLGLLGAVAVLFCTLTVEVRGDELRLFFGPRLIRRRFTRAEIVSAEPVRNEWHYGWGIRFTAFGWLFSVSGLDAVEIALDSGKRVRIGTDEPRQLAEAIRRLIARR